MEKCIFCNRKRIVKNGKTLSGEQEYFCQRCNSYFTPSSNPDYPKSRFDADTMRLSTIWYFRFQLSFRNIAELILARNIDVSHQTIRRWVKMIGPELGKFARKRWTPRRTVSWYVDETYVKIKGVWKYLYRAVDRNGEVFDVMLSETRDKKAARRFFSKTLKFFKIKPERVYTDKNPAYPKAIKGRLKAKHGIMHIAVTPIERSHVPVKRRYHAMLGFNSFDNAYSFTENFEYIRGYVGGLNSSNKRERSEVWKRINNLIQKKSA